MAVSPDHANADFHYPGLDASNREFRVFTFHGRDELGMLHGRLTTVSLLRDLKCIALSYEWGDDKPEKTIIMNDHPFRVRDNLYSFLESVAKQPRLEQGIFIDALCINQADRAERSSQVRLMPDIYTQAAEIRAWLGPMPVWWTESPSLSDLWTTVEKSDWGNFMYYLRTVRNPSSPLTFPVSQATEWVSKSSLDNLTIVAARVAAQRPFWKRLWIVQELLLARSLSLHVGDRVLAPKTVLRVSRAMSGYFDDVSESLVSIIPMPTMGTRSDALSDGLRFQDAAIILSRKYDNAEQSDTRPLHDVLEAFAMQQCREPRDHVFGLLGLCSSAVQPDYDIPLPQLYLYALLEARMHLECDSSLSSVQAGFKACVPAMTAFGWNISDMTVHMLIKQALHGTDISMILWFSLWTVSTSLNQRGWPRVFRWFLEAVQLVLLVLLPFGWWQTMYVHSGARSPVVYAYLPTMSAYGAQSTLLALLQWLDCELAAPDGQVRTCSAWRREVHRIAALVKDRKPLEPLSARDMANCYPQDHEDLRKRRVRLVSFSGAATPLMAWTLCWALLILVFTTLFQVTATIFSPLIRDLLASVLPQWVSLWKVSLAAYGLYRIFGLGSTFPAQI